MAPLETDPHAAFRDRPRLTVAITGASGLIGSELSAFLTAGGHRVRPVVRRSPATPDEIQWRPSEGTIDAAAFEGIDAVAHLAGESIASGRWTAERKQRIRESRTQGTALLASTLISLRQPPRVFISSSAVGYYGDLGAEIATESTPAGTGFLADVCREWEAATSPASEAGIRTVILRTGVVLTAQGGALGKMLLPFRMGLGGRIGSGEQGFPWIAIDDIVGMYHQALMDESWVGPYNATAPEPPSQREFAAALAHVLHRPAFAPLPAFMVKLLFGEMGDALLLQGARAAPRRATEAGFRFRYPELQLALRHLLERKQ